MLCERLKRGASQNSVVHLVTTSYHKPSYTLRVRC